MVSLSQYNVNEQYEIVNEYDQEIPQSQTADKSRHREEEPHNNH